jgi:hypothetical protein
VPSVGRGSNKAEFVGVGARFANFTPRGGALRHLMGDSGRGAPTALNHYRRNPRLSCLIGRGFL